MGGPEAGSGQPDPVVLANGARPASPIFAKSSRWWLIGLSLSILGHTALLLAFLSQVPQELPSIGIPAISVEIVLGDDSPAGIAAAPGQEAPPAANEEPKAKRADYETSPEPPSVAARTDPPPAVDDTASTREVTAAETQPSPMVSAETPPGAEQISVEPQPKPGDEAPPERFRPPARIDLEEPKNGKEGREPKKTRPVQASTPPAPSASGVGRGRSSPEANYPSLVAAHLARHKQFPPDARRRGQQGSAGISFSLDGGGRVTDVKLTRSSGSAILDREAQSMVRRASPFPPPPRGQPQSFSVPVSFLMR